MQWKIVRPLYITQKLGNQEYLLGDDWHIREARRTMAEAIEHWLKNYDQIVGETPWEAKVQLAAQQLGYARVKDAKIMHDRTFDARINAPMCVR